MGFFTGRFKRWDPLFVFLAIVLCVVARALNVFPLSLVCNATRKTKIPLRMQMVIWFAGLRGAIAFALSQNMPGPHKDVYETTTLSVVVFTTVVCGGLTEPILRKAGMKRAHGEASLDDDDAETPFIPPGGAGDYELLERNAERPPSPAPAGAAAGLGMHGAWREIDNRYMKPLFGGQLPGAPPRDDDASQPKRYPPKRLPPSRSPVVTL